MMFIQTYILNFRLLLPLGRQALTLPLFLMIRNFYALLTAGTLLLLSPHNAFAASSRSPLPDSPTETQRKAAREKVVTAKKEKVALRKSSRSKFNLATKMSHGMRVAFGLEESKAVTSPAERDRQLHRLQRQLKTRARMESKARMRRTHC